MSSVRVACACDPALYGSHSLRRGGASWALKCGFSGDLIRLIGDWKSDAYMAYLDLPVESRVALARRLSGMVRSQVTG